MDKIFQIRDSFVRTSFIVGHPGEEEKDFLELLDFIQKVDFDMINIFEYCDEENTPAFFRDDKIEENEKKRRVKEIQKIVDKKLKQKLKKYIGQDMKVMLNGYSDETKLLYSAKNIQWAPEIDPEILINDSDINEMKVGKIYNAHITSSTDKELIGVILSSNNE